MRNNEQLLLTLRKLEDRMRESGMGIEELIRENPAVIEETKGQAIRDLSDVSTCLMTAAITISRSIHVI